jgi:hypothetical protein
VGHFFADAGDAEKLATDLGPPGRVDLLVAHALAKLPDGQLKEHLTGLIFVLEGKEPVTVAAA